MRAWIAHHIGHRRFLPALVDLFVAFLAFLRTDVMCRSDRGGLRDSFPVRQRSKAANEQNQLPCSVARLPMRILQSGHPGEADTILDDVVNLAVCEFLGWRFAQIGRARVEMGSDPGPSAAVDSMTNRAMGNEQITALRQGFGIFEERIFLSACPPGNGKVSDGASTGCFKSGRRFNRPESAPTQYCHAENSGEGKSESHPEGAFHAE